MAKKTKAQREDSKTSMESLPKVSIVLCCYNQEDFVLDAMKSVLAQTHSNTELIVIDNGSTDNSAKVIRDFLVGNLESSRIISIFHKKNDAVTKRLNEGIRAATGEFVSILYADDYFLPEKTTLQLAAFAKLSKDYGVVYCPGYRVNVITGARWQERTMNSSGDILKEMLVDFQSHGFINPISPLIRKECLDKYPFREELFIEGEGIFFRIAVKYKFKYSPEPLVVMRDHPNNAGKAIKKTKDIVVQHCEFLLQDKEFPKELTPVIHTHLGTKLRNYGWQALRIAEDPQWARQCFTEAVHWDPKQALHPKVFGGTALSLLPRSLMGMINNAGNRLRHSEGLRSFKADNQ